MITKKRLQALEAMRPRLNETRHYTIGGPVETAVHSFIECERIGEMNRGYRLINSAVENFRNNMAFKSREGLARTQFEHVKKDHNHAHDSAQQPTHHNGYRR